MFRLFFDEWRKGDEGNDGGDVIVD